MNQKELLKFGENILKQQKIEDAYLKATILLEYVLKQTKQQLVINDEKEVSEEKRQQYIESLEKIVKNIPIQYITNKQSFMGIDLYVDENVLIPQPDTEILVEEAIKTVKVLQQQNEEVKENNKIRILDLCTGSGAIAISLAKYCENLEIIATDISKKAINVARKNAKNNNVDIKFIQSDLFENIKENKFDIIVSNPPYIETEIIQTLSKEVQNEPNIALDGGKDGLYFYKKILKQAPNYLKLNGYILLEIGYDQGTKVIQLAKDNIKPITKQPIKDLGGNDRVVGFKI